MGDERSADQDADTVQAEEDSIDTPRPVSVSGELRARSHDDRYQTAGSLGHGGMGFVRLCRDEQIGRKIAMKVLRPEMNRYDEARQRFVREARVQGQLEHPAIVPVYDLGLSPDGAVFFTMKRVHGATLEEVFDGLRRGRAGYAERFGRRRLLTAFASVCLALDFAHQRGVLHRDLKPANIMLGEFGEVYLLDWGLARLASQRDSEAGLRDASTADTMRLEAAALEAELHAAATQVPPTGSTLPGAVLGTPGYMSPEQLAGKHDQLGPESDVYGLGALLFELLTLEPLHVADSVAAIANSTRNGADARATVRAPDREVPPELEAICVRATAQEPTERYPNARALHEALDRYLAGERDRDKRRELAARHAERAEALAERVRDGEGIATRRAAMREIGRAIALDPDDDRAIRAMVDLLAQPPEAPPIEVEAELRRSDRRQARWAARSGIWVYASTLLYIPIALWVGLQDLWYLVPVYGCAAVCFGLSLQAARARKPSMRVIAATMVVSTLMIVSLWPLFGPLVLMPTLVVVNAVAFATYLDRAYRPLLYAASSLAILVPIGLEAAGVIGASYSFTEAGMVIHSRAVELDSSRVIPFLTVITLAMLFTGVVLVTRVRDELRGAESHLYTYAWHLREFIPPAARSSTDPRYTVRMQHQRAAKRRHEDSGT